MAPDGFDIQPCAPGDRKAALELVLRSLPANQRGPLVETLGRLRDEPLGAFDALVTAKARGRLVAAAWAQPQAGRTASLWLPETKGVRSDRVATPLIELAVRLADVAGVELSQALLESPSDAAVTDLVAAGFNRVTDLQYLEWTPQKLAEDSSDESAVAVEPVDTIERPELERLVAATYQETLDCPELDGLRSVSDVLAGYQQTGDFDPALWFVLRNGGRPVGVLLLNEHQTSRQIELTYMGVAADARGHGVGRVAVRAAQRVALERNADRLVLAVDARNSPARAIYRDAGFTAWASRTVFLRPKP